MGIKLLGADGTTEPVVDSTHQALRTSLRPDQYGALGHYARAKASGVMAAGLAANSEIFQLRYTGANVLCVEEVILTGAGGIVGFAAGIINIELYRATAWSVDGSGGTAFTVTGDQGKLKTSMSQAMSVGIAARVSSTAALTAGTKALDTDPLGAAITSVPATAGQPIFDGPRALWQPMPGQMPAVLVNTEGVVIRATVPATGTWTFGISIRVKELTAAVWPG